MTPDKDPNCLFCKIIAKQIPSQVVAEGEEFLAIRDINPQAPTHVLVMPRQHVRNVGEARDAQALGKLFQAAATIGVQEKLDHGFRLVVNTGSDGGQTVDHLHVHVIGGRPMHWPPG